MDGSDTLTRTDYILVNPPSPFDDFTIDITDASGKVGEEVCVSVKAYHLTDILAILFAIDYDPAALEFNRIENINPTFDDDLTFGDPIQTPGTLTIQRFSFEGISITLANGAIFFDICFIVLEESETILSFKHPSATAPIEITDNNENNLPFNGNLGIVNGIPTSVIADFSSNKQVAFQHESIQFSDESIGNVTNWIWNFPGGSPSTSIEQNPIIAYHNPGTYEVTLTALDANAGKNTTFKLDYIKIEEAAAPSDTLILDITDGVGNIGEEICLEVNAYNFNQITGATFAIDYDPDILRFNQAQELNPDLGDGEFAVPGDGAVLPGSISFSWFPNDLEPRTLKAGETLFKLCFEILQIEKTALDIKAPPIAGGLIEVLDQDFNRIIVKSNRGTVNNISAPIIETFQVTNVDCPGKATGAIDLTITGGTGEYSYQWNYQNRATPNLINLPAGDYTVTISDNGTGLITQEVFTVEEPNLIDIQFNQQDITCFGKTDGTIELEISGGTPGYQISWSNGLANNQPGLTGLHEGSYFATVTDSKGCSQLSPNIEIRSPSPLQIIGINSRDIENGNDGRISLTIEGGSNNYSYNWQGPDGFNATTKDIVNLSVDGEYCVTIVDNPTCRLDTCISIGASLSINATKANVSCHGRADGQINIIIKGGKPPFSIDFSDGITLESLTDRIIERKDLAAGLLDYTVTDNNNISVSEQILINGPTAIDITKVTVVHDSEEAGCNGSIEVEISGGSGSRYDVRWNNSQRGNQISFLCESSSGFIPTITDGDGCTKVFAPIYINTFTATGSITQANCSEGAIASINLEVTGGTLPYSFEWKNEDGEIISSEEDILDLSPGTYTANISEASGNQLTKIFTIENEAANISPPISNGDKSICPNDPIPELSATVDNGLTINWYDSPLGGNLLAANTLNYRPASIGIYYAAAVSIDGQCSSTERTPIAFIDDNAPQIQEWQKVCSAESVTIFLQIEDADEVIVSEGNLYQGEGPNTYFIEGIPFGSTTNVLATNKSGCFTEIQISGECCEVAAPVISEDRAILCLANNDPIGFEAQVPTGHTVYWYRQLKGGQPLLKNSLDFYTTQQGIYYAETRRIDDPSCFSAERTRVFVGSVPSDNPAIEEYKKYCTNEGSTYSIEFTILRAQKVSTSQPYSSSDLIHYRIDDVPITESIEIIAINANSGCEASFQSSAPFCACDTLPLPVPINDSYTFCPDSPPPLLEVNVPIDLSVDWFDQPDGGRRLASNSLTFRPNQPGHYYAETVIPDQECPNNGRILVSVEKRDINIIQDTILTCDMGLVGTIESEILQDDTDCPIEKSKFYWLSRPPLQIDTTIYVCNPSEVDTKQILEKNQDGCSVIFNQYLEYRDSSDNIVLMDDAFEFSPSETIAFINPLENDIYPEIFDFTILNFPDQGRIDLNEVDGRPNGELLFTAPDQPQNIIFDYRVCVPGCPLSWCDTATVTFKIKCDVDIEATFFTIITPNGDGKNDEFHPLEIFLQAGCPISVEKVKLRIANRQGEVVFQTQETYIPWQGKSNNGSPVPSGTYFFLLEIEQEEAYKGYIDLIY